MCSAPRRSAPGPTGLIDDGLVARAVAENLSPPRDRDAEQEGDEKAGERCLARDRSDGRESPAGLARFFDGRGQTVDGRVQASGDFTDCARDIRRRIEGALGDAGLGRGLRYLRAQARDLQT